MSERINETALTVSSPRRFVIPDWVATALRTRIHGARDKGIGIVAEDFDPCGSDAQLGGTLPTVGLRLTKKERRAGDLHSRNRSEIPQFGGTKRALVPFDGRRSISDGQHHGYDRPARWGRSHRCPVNSQVAKPAACSRTL